MADRKLVLHIDDLGYHRTGRGGRVGGVLGSSGQRDDGGKHQPADHGATSTARTTRPG